VARWLSPSTEIPLHVLAYDFRVNGRYRFEYRVPTGQIMHVNGEFRAIDPPSRIVFTWVIEPPDEHAGIDSEVIVSIAAVSGGSMLTLIHERLGRTGAVERHTGGWLGALDRLEVLLATDRAYEA
jgi:uncharacterized protein YndB with AHSA1/START domain